MKKENIVLIAVFILAVSAVLSMNLTGKMVQQPAQKDELNELIKTAIASAPLESKQINIETLSIGRPALEKIELLKENECIDVIIQHKPEIFEQKVMQAKEKTLPLKIAAIAPIKQPFTPFVPSEKKAELEEIIIKKAVISDMQKEITILSEEKFSNVHTYKNFPVLSGCLSKEGLATLVENKPEIIISEDFIFSETVLESVELIEANKVWKRKVADQTIKGAGINVAIIDSGIDYRHNDLGSCLGPDCKVVEGWNTIDHNEDVIDVDGHGTHLAGVIASVAPEASLIAIKSCQHGFCSASKIAEGIDWCLEHGCNIATLSLGDGGSYNPEECKKLEMLRPVFKEASNRSLVIFVSSGNEGKLWPSYPACDANVISVGSVNDWDDKISDFSNLHADIFAPGVSITSTWPNNEKKTMAGTSQAAAFAAGLTALYTQAYFLVKKRSPTPLLIEEQLEINSNPVYDVVSDMEYPRINALMLLESLLGAEPLPSFACGNFECEFELGEDAENCPVDCKMLPILPLANITEIIKENFTLSFDIRNWEGDDTKTRIEARNSVIEGLMYPDKREIKLPEAVYDMKLSYGLFSAVFRSINLDSSLLLKANLEDLTQKVQKLPELPYAKVKAVYSLGLDDSTKSVIVCFDKKLAGESTFVFHCPWQGYCANNWSMLMSMKPRETSCLLLATSKGTAFAVAEIPEAVCGNTICEFGETAVSCPQDCKIKLKEAALRTEEKRPIWPLIVIFAIAVILIAIGVFLKKTKKPKQKSEQKRKPKQLELPKPPSPSQQKSKPLKIKLPNLPKPPKKTKEKLL